MMQNVAERESKNWISTIASLKEGGEFIIMAAITKIEHFKNYFSKQCIIIDNYINFYYNPFKALKVN